VMLLCLLSTVTFLRYRETNAVDLECV
jgi:hypothetical protein